MRVLAFVLFTAALSAPAAAAAGKHKPFDYAFQVSYERGALDGRSLGDDPLEDRLLEQDIELEFSLEYRVSNDLYLFFTGALIDESETVDNAGIEQNVSGLERREIGLGYFFGDRIDSLLRLGRTEFDSASEWWLWWDEELDAIRLDSSLGDFEMTLGLAQEQARESTGVDFIDPEFDEVRRLLLGVGWEFADDHSLFLYYLDQTDDSGDYTVGEFEDDDRVDEEDADLEWSGIAYLGVFAFEDLGDLGIELHAARVSGKETVYEFDDPVGGRAEVSGRERRKVSGEAYGLMLSWTPVVLDEWTFVLGRAVGSGDGNPDDDRVGSYRQTGLQGDSETFGELYRPELSNLVVDTVGIRWKISDGVELSLLRYAYEQDVRADEMRDVAIEFDPDGNSRELGREVDLVLTVETRKDLELIVTAAEFDPGSAYAAKRAETATFFNFEIAYEF